MTSLEALRWGILSEGAFVLGALVALYERLWRFLLPATAHRAVGLGIVATAVGYLIGIHDRLTNDALSWRDVLAASVFTLYLVGLLSLYLWYRMPEGRRQRHRLIAEFNAWRLVRVDEERQRHEDDVRRGF